MYFYDSNKNKIIRDDNLYLINNQQYKELQETYQKQIERDEGEIVYNIESDTIVYKEKYCYIVVLKNKQINFIYKPGETVIDQDMDIEPIKITMAQRNTIIDDYANYKVYYFKDGQVQSTVIEDGYEFDWTKLEAVPRRDRSIEYKRRRFLDSDIEADIKNRGLYLYIPNIGDVFYPINEGTVAVVGLIKDVEKPARKLTVNKRFGESFTPVLLESKDLTDDIVDALVRKVLHYISFIPIIVEEYKNEVKNCTDDAKLVGLMNNYIENILTRIEGRL